MEFTYLTDSEFRDWTKVSNTDLNEIFQEVRTLFPDKYYLQERTFISQRVFRKDKEVVRYQLYIVSSQPEVQVFNFPSEGSSLAGYVTASMVYTYFLGLINGRNHETK